MVVEFVAVLVLTGTVIKKNNTMYKAYVGVTGIYCIVYWYKDINKNHYGPFWNSFALLVEPVCH